VNWKLAVTLVPTAAMARAVVKPRMPIFSLPTCLIV